MVVRRIVGNSVVRAIAGRFVPPTVRAKVSAAIVESPDAELFQKLLSDRASMVAVPGRVLMVCGSLQPGGAERQVANTLIGLAAAPLESVTLLCDFLQGGTPEKRDFYLPLAQTSGALVREINTNWSKAEQDSLPRAFREAAPHLHPSLVSDVANLYHEIRALRPDVVHAWLDWSNVRAGLAAVLAGVPKVILSGRNLNPTHFAFNTDYFHPAYEALAKYAAGRVTIFNNSQAGADDYADWLGVPPESVKVLRNGVQFTDDMRPSAGHKSAFRACLGVPEDALLIGGMFRFSPEKQPLLWLETAAKISQTLPDAHFVVFGQGVMREHMEKHVQKLGIAAHTHLCEVITPSLDGLSPCDLVMLTSSGEGTPNVLLEAQWLGVPVVTTAAGGAGEAVLDGVTGIVVHQKDADAIARAALAILRNRDFRNAVREEGPAFISSRYGMDRMIKETLAAYQLDTPT